MMVPSQPISGCLQTFTENSLLYSVFLLTLFLITFSPRAVDIVKCPWSSFFIYDTLILTILHYIPRMLNLLEHVLRNVRKARPTDTRTMLYAFRYKRDQRNIPIFQKELIYTMCCIYTRPSIVTLYGDRAIGRVRPFVSALFWTNDLDFLPV